MQVYLVKHHNTENYASDNSESPKLPKITKSIDQAYRFGTQQLAEKCVGRMIVPVAWIVVAKEFVSGQFVN